MKEKNKLYSAHFMIGASPVVLVKVLINNKFNISLRYLPRFLATLIITLFFLPVILLEKLLYSRRINKTELRTDPIFIIGHARSGTTYMHNLLTKDDQFNFPNTFQCIMPNVFLIGGAFMKNILQKLIPHKRPMDNVLLHTDFPQEDEFGMVASSPLSYFHALSFPQKTRSYFSKYGLMETHEINRWSKKYSFFFKKIALANPHKQIVSKNPINTTRIKALLAIYPNAKFIYMKRNREEVLNSAFNLYSVLTKQYSFQTISKQVIEENMLWLYDKTISTYEQERTQIADDHLIEVAYNDLIDNPLREMKRIYKSLKLSDFKRAEASFAKYIESQKGFVTNSKNFIIDKLVSS